MSKPKICFSCKGEIKKGQQSTTLFKRSKEEIKKKVENTEKTFHKFRSDCVYKSI